MRRPVARAPTLPGAPYLAPEILAAEMEEIDGEAFPGGPTRLNEGHRTMTLPGDTMGDRLLADGRAAEDGGSSHDGGQGRGEATRVTAEADPAAERERGTGEGTSGEARP